ncbi:hypothetical protein D0T57_12895 [Dysgonomonas sp. 511]|nr:hypothetical protein [Dysgonomonas sp. 511]
MKVNNNLIDINSNISPVAGTFMLTANIVSAISMTFSGLKRDPFFLNPFQLFVYHVCSECNAYVSFYSLFIAMEYRSYL